MFGARHIDLTEGNITKTMLLFAVPMILGNFLQQLYNIADTLIVGKFLGADALAAVGSSYTLMTFLISLQLGLCMGSGAVFSIQWGAGSGEKLKSSIFVSFVLIGAVTLVLNVAAFIWTDPVMNLLRVPTEIYGIMRVYLRIVFWGMGFVFLYNYFACLLRAVGDSVTPLWFLAGAVLLNTGLDFLFILGFGWNTAGAAWATVISQGMSAAGIGIFTFYKYPRLYPDRKYRRMQRCVIKEIASYSLLTGIQQSIMNFGILMVQGLVNSFGTAVMAAFAAAVKIDSLAYMPAQDFGNAFSTFIAQNYGAGKSGRIRGGIRSAVIAVSVFCLLISALVWVFARPLMLIFIRPHEKDIIAIGMEYLRIEGAFYWGIGFLFLLYGFYRAVRMPGMSVVLTVISLGSRVALAYILAAVPAVGVKGIWWSVPIGWVLADLAGWIYYRRNKKRVLPSGTL